MTWAGYRYVKSPARWSCAKQRTRYHTPAGAVFVSECWNSSLQVLYKQWC